MRPNLANAFRIEEGNIAIYLRDISRYRPLSSKEECEAAARIRAGDSEALERLVKTNLRFVVSVARNYQHQGLSLADLVNEGNIGLIRAARRFDEKKNFKFISYAVWWIRQSILQGLANQSRILRVPINRVATIHRLGRTRSRLEQKYRRAPNVDEVADELGISCDDVLHTMQIGASHRSLDAPAGGDPGSSLLDTLDDAEQEPPDGTVMFGSCSDDVLRLLNMLSAREQRVLRLYFGIDEETGHTLDEIASRLNITRERVRQIREYAIGKLRRLRTVVEAAVV